MDAERYDRRYFDRWYRREGFGSTARLDRKVGFALGAAEYLLERPVRSVLDVGAGEGAWAPALRRRRPRLRYVGVDPSAYAVERFGTRRGLHQGGLADLDDPALGLDELAPFDLVVCSDVLAYAPASDVRAGLRSLGRLLGGVALVEVFTSSDPVEGDLDGARPRSAAVYERWFDEAGLTRVGPHLYVGAALGPSLATFERGRP